MKDYLAILLEKIKSLIGPAWSIVPILAELKQALAAEDVAKVQAISGELRESALAQIALCDHLDRALLDDAVSLGELAKAIDLVQTIVDEAEDVAKGIDEDG